MEFQGPMSPKIRRALVPLLAFVLGLVGLAGAAVYAILPERAPQATASVGGPFSLVDQDGKTRVPAGKNMTDEELGKMDYYVEGVASKLPKK